MSLSEQSSQQLEQSHSTLANFYTEKIREAASKAAIDIAVNELVSAKNSLHSSKPNARFKLYDVTIKSLASKWSSEYKGSLAEKSLKVNQWPNRIEQNHYKSKLTIEYCVQPILNSPATNIHSPMEASSNPQHPGCANGCTKGSSKTQKKAMEVNKQKCLDKILTEYRKV